MDSELRRRIVYFLLSSIMLYVLFVYNSRESILSNPVQSAIVSISFFSVVAIIIIAIYPEILSPQRKMERIDDFVVIIATLTFLFIGLSLINSFGTDNMEYTYEALNNFFQGKNPYEMVYGPHTVQPTYTLSGGVASNFIYPPFSFIVYIPIYLLIKAFNLPGYVLNAENVIFAVILGLLLYKIGKEKDDPFALFPVIFLYIITAVSIPPFYGVPIVIASTFLALSYVKKNYLGGISLALAISFSQLSWLAFPFLLIYRIRSDNVGKQFLRSSYFLSFLITLSIINIPFLAWNPVRFIGNIITLNTQLIPVGQIGLTVISYSGLYPMEPWFFTIVFGVVAIFLTYLYYQLFDYLKEIIWLFPLIISWFLWRTLTEYFFMWIPLIFTSLFRTQYKLPTIKLNFKKKIVLPLLIIFVFLASLSVYAHESYVASNPLKIDEVYTLQNTPPYTALIIKVQNTKNEPVNITLVRVSIPNNLNMVWNSTETVIPPNSSALVFAYASNSLEAINSTPFTVQVYSEYYFATYTVNSTQ
ncbi:hypothetical protein [Sulfolobus acidocaldarius]|uniref:hypothetical protein n=2 Tax=Sulfolobus acidocaldarius TaxID=2285 RepID=UPI000B1A8F41|nr:hypothetical protein [Sulfolobus acidocaldarius]